jgi:hypothetical protein
VVIRASCEVCNSFSFRMDSPSGYVPLVLE